MQRPSWCGVRVCVMQTHVPLDEEEAVTAVAAAVRRLFIMLSERRARELATMVLRELRRSKLQLVRTGD
jgi:hypothetical protein